MPSDDSYLRHQQQRWLRHDAHLWIRPDAARWVKPGYDPGEIYPTLKRKDDATKQPALSAELAAEVARGYRLNAVLRKALAEVKADMARQRAAYSEESKYSPSQPRVPRGNPDGGQWTDRGGGQGTVASPSQDTGQSTAASLTQPMGNVGIGDVSGSSELGDLFRIKPSERGTGDVRLAGDLPASEPPKIPQTRPDSREDRMTFVRSAAAWLGRMSGIGLAADFYVGAMNNVAWLDDYRATIQSYRDPPKTLEELQDGVGQSKPGYDDHHIVEKTAAERWGFARSEVDDPSNVVKIPRMKHWDITRWYMKENESFGGLSPREYLRDKNLEERRRVGLGALIDAGVLKP